MSGAVDTARRLLERTGEHPVISVYFDLDPERFATAPARASQARALVDEGHRTRESLTSLSHEDRKAFDEDLARLDDYLGSDELPVSGARALAVFCSGQDGLFETVTLRAPAESTISIAPTPRVEPLVTQPDDTVDAERERALERLQDTAHAVTGVTDTLEALNERRVEALLLSRDFAASGGRCPTDGILVPEGVDTCPADGAAVTTVGDLREAAVQSALGQDAAVFAFDQPRDELPAAHPVGALLRF